MEIKKELVVKAPPARVYKAIIDPEQLTQWFPDIASLEPKIGGKVYFRFLQSKADNLIDKDYTMEGKVIELEENKKLVYTWKHPDIPDFPQTRVSWVLEETLEGMTKVTITHTGFSDENTMKQYNEGWSWFSGRLSIFATAKGPVNIHKQTIYSIIPGLDAHAASKINKARRLTIIGLLIVSAVGFGGYGIAYLLDQYNLVTITIVVIIATVVYLSSASYLMRKWSKEWNEKFLKAE